MVMKNSAIFSTFRKAPFLLLLTAILFLVIMMVNTSIGYADAHFLTFTPGARANGLASAFTAIADDIYAAYYNDAGLGFQNRLTFGWYGSWSPHFTFFKKEDCSFLGAVLPIPIVGGSFAISALYYNYNDVDFYHKISYGRKISRYLSLGVGGKLVAIGCGGWALDFSGLYQRTDFRAGLTIQNVGLYVSQEDRTVPFPIIARIGLYDKFLMYEGHEIAITLDVVRNFTHMNLFRICGGTEYIYHNFLSLRLGYQSNISGGRSGLTYGMGVVVRNDVNRNIMKIDVGIAETEASSSLSATEFSIVFRM